MLRANRLLLNTNKKKQFQYTMPKLFFNFGGTNPEDVALADATFPTILLIAITNLHSENKNKVF